jgi:L-ribulose-5-phosphate 3-epimerase
MASLKVGVRLICLRVPGPKGLETAARIGAESVQLTVGRGEYAPEELAGEKLRATVRHIRDWGLVISATDGGLGDLADPAGREERVARAKRLLEHTAALGAPVLTSHIGTIPPDRQSAGYTLMREAIEEIGTHAERVGVAFGIETGPEPPAVLRSFLESLRTKAVRVNLDPANFILWPAILARRGGYVYNKAKALAESDPHQAVYELRGSIVHTHAKDARVKEDGTPEEVPLGQGWIDWQRYLRAYQEIGFTGYHVIEREHGENRVEETRQAITFLRATAAAL